MSYLAFYWVQLHKQFHHSGRFGPQPGSTNPHLQFGVQYELGLRDYPDYNCPKFTFRQQQIGFPPKRVKQLEQLHRLHLMFDLMPLTRSIYPVLLFQALKISA